MKILITNAYARGSGGDMAILDSLLSELQRVFPHPEIVVATIDEPKNLQQIFPQVKCVSSLITTVWKEEDPRLLKLLSLLRSFCSSLLWARQQKRGGRGADYLLKRNERETLHQLADADLVVAVGGGYIREEAGMVKIIDLAITLRLLYLSHLLGKTTVLYSQSIGPFGDRRQQDLAGFVLKRMQLIITRESVSRSLLRQMGIPDELVLESTDCAFLARSGQKAAAAVPELDRLQRNYRGPLVGVTARSWLKEEKQCRYERELAQALDNIISKYDAHVLLIPQTTVKRKEDDDRIVQERIFARLTQKNRATCLRGAYGHRELLDIYGRLNYLIGTRFHSAIFALTGRVPTLAIAYEHKAVGIMQDLGLERYVLDIKEVEAQKLGAAFDRLHADRTDYLRQLDRTLPRYIQRSRQAAERMQEVYQKLANQKIQQAAAIGEEEAAAQEGLAQQERPGDPDRAPLQKEIE